MDMGGPPTETITTSIHDFGEPWRMTRNPQRDGDILVVMDNSQIACHVIAGCAIHPHASFALMAAERIVDCVNALAGIPRSALMDENSPVSKVLIALRELHVALDRNQYEDRWDPTPKERLDMQMAGFEFTPNGYVPAKPCPPKAEETAQ